MLTMKLLHNLPGEFFRNIVRHFFNKRLHHQFPCYLFPGFRVGVTDSIYTVYIAIANDSYLYPVFKIYNGSGKWRDGKKSIFKYEIIAEGRKAVVPSQ